MRGSLKRLAALSPLRVRRRLARGLAVVVLAAPGLVGLTAAPMASGPRAAVQDPAAAPGRVNRTVPRVTPPAPTPVFSPTPTDEEIFRARVLGEPFVPVGGATTPDENRALGAALRAYRAAGRLDDVTPFEAFLAAHPRSAWRASVQANLAAVLWAQGYLSRALAAWDDAWALARDVETPAGRAVAGLALGDALDALATVGQTSALEARLAALAGTPLGGSGGAKVQQARLVLAQLRAQPDHVIPSGAQAVAVLRARRRGEPPAIASPRPGGGTGASLAEVQALAQAAGLDLAMVVRPPGAALPVPAIVHLNLGHYVAVVDRRGEAYQLHDPAFGGTRWWAAAALEAESTGYGLVETAAVPAGWRTPSAAEAAAVVGQSCPPGAPERNEPCDPPQGTCCVGGGAAGGPAPAGPTAPACGGPSCGVATYAFKASSAGLVLTDTPAGYVPARGPAIPFTLTYDARQTLQPALFAYTHVGPRWTLHWVSYAKEVPFWIDPGFSNEYVPEHISLYLRGGGEEIFEGPPDAGGAYPAHWRSRAQLVRVSADPIRYERRHPDGGVDIYALADAAPVGQRRVFLTEVRDARGHAATLTYDAAYRIVAITDALGQVSVLAYDAPEDPRRLTGVTDPFGRRATLTYTPTGQLAAITDVGGLTSAFGYLEGDFLGTLTTPYGTTTFRHEASDPVNHPWIEATGPLGATERLEYHWSTPAVPASVPAAEVPAGFAAANAQLDQYVTFYWDPRAWAAGPGEVATAAVTRWLVKGGSGPYAPLLAVPVPHSVERPGAGRVWYRYPGQTTRTLGWTRQPSVVARVLDDGTTQETLATYNASGHVTSRTDPLGRTTTYTYAANGRDLLEVRQTTGGANDLVASYADYTLSGQPQTVTDAAGQTTTLTYAATGEVATVTNARGETTTYAYDGDGRLASVTGPVNAATTSYTYDAHGRVPFDVAQGTPSSVEGCGR
ncbi:MAG: hypothetical protein KJ066_02575 [Acidobacteria bacterium]|nr:hypothetical protein [Acidobacteriota bacterium]